MAFRINFTPAVSHICGVANMARRRRAGVKRNWGALSRPPCVGALSLPDYIAEAYWSSFNAACGMMLACASMDVPLIIALEAGLSFLGMGVQPPMTS